MAQVSVNIAGRAYRMACEDGQEPHLEQLARNLDARIGEMKHTFGEIGDQRLTVMAAIAMADDSSEAQRKIERLEAEVAELRAATASSKGAAAELEQRVALALDEVATRIERAARKMDAAR